MQPCLFFNPGRVATGRGPFRTCDSPQLQGAASGRRHHPHRAPHASLRSYTCMQRPAEGGPPPPARAPGRARRPQGGHILPSCESRSAVLDSGWGGGWERRMPSPLARAALWGWKRGKETQSVICVSQRSYTFHSGCRLARNWPLLRTKGPSGCPGKHLCTIPEQ